MTAVKPKLLFLMPLALGLYCVFQGSILLSSAELVAQLLGVLLFLWVPACAFYAWRGRKAFAPSVAASTQEIEASEFPEYEEAVE